MKNTLFLVVLFALAQHIYSLSHPPLQCQAGTKWQNCWKQDCDQSETKTKFKLEMNRDCNGKLTTTTEVTDKNGRKNQIENASNCFDSQCQMPDCPDHVEKICRSTISHPIRPSPPVRPSSPAFKEANGGTCSYECKKDGVCQVDFEANGSYSGGTRGSCTSEEFGWSGDCSGTPRFCTDCKHKCRGKWDLAPFSEIVGSELTQSDCNEKANGLSDVEDNGSYSACFIKYECRLNSQGDDCKCFPRQECRLIVD